MQHPQRRSDARGDGHLPSLPDVLREMSVQAADTLYENLRITRALVAARLSCRALRDTLDGSVQSNFESITEQDVENWRPGQAPALARWPRCSKVQLCAEGLGDLSGTEAHVALALPFAGLPAERCRGITELKVADDVEVGSGEHWYAESAIAAVVMKLPMLRRLDLSHVDGMSHDPLHEQLLCDALASLPHLKFLGLPDCGNLVGLCGAVGDRLKELGIRVSRHGFDSVPAALSQLRVAERITLDSWGINGTPDFNCRTVAVRLLGCLPPSVHTLYMPNLRASSTYRLKIEFHLQADGLGSVHVSPSYSDHHYPCDLAELADEVILPCLPAGYQLECLTLSGICIPCASEQQLLSTEQLQRLRELVRRTGMVEVKSLVLLAPLDAEEGEGEGHARARVEAQVQQAEQVLEVLGCPGEVVLVVPIWTFEPKAITHQPFRFRLKLSGGGSGSAATAMGAGPARQEVGSGGTAELHVEQQQQQPLLSGPQLVQLVLQRMVANYGAPPPPGASAASAASSPEGGEAPAAAFLAVGGVSAPASRGPGLLLLQGPCAALMAQAPAELFKELASWLVERAASGLPADAPAPEGLYVLPIPTAEAVLVQVKGVGEAAAVAAVAAAARSLAGRQTGGGMEVAAAGSPSGCAPTKNTLRLNFVTVLQQVMQETWSVYVRSSCDQQQQRPGSCSDHHPNALPPELLPLLLDVRCRVLPLLPGEVWYPWPRK